MGEWLCIHLAGTMASFGDEAGNVQRGTSDRPTRSALLGLAGAALGIRRDDAAGQVALSSSFSTSTRTLEAGKLLTDFHTYEGVQQSRTFYRTRAHALAAGRRNTAITRREYRSGGHWLAAYHQRPDATITAASLANAFRKPVFALWLGRKSCPLSSPLDPVILEAEDAAGAFSAYLHSREARGLDPLPSGALVATDERANIPGSNGNLRHHQRLDQPIDRRVWTFRYRDEFEFVSGSDPIGGDNGL